MITLNEVCITDKEKRVLDEVMLDEYLLQEGFYCYYNGHNQSDMTRVRVIGRRLHFVSANQLYMFLYGRIKQSHPEWLKALKANRLLLFPTAMAQMQRIEPTLLKDTATTSYLPFDNGVVSVTKHGVQILTYEEVLKDKCLLNDKIIQRTINLDAGDYRAGVWYRFCRNAVGEEGLPYLMRALGYLLHGYKDKSNAKMILLTDSVSSKISGKAMGGTGKSMIANDALKALRNVFWEDGKEFNPKGTFKFQGITANHDIICLDDINHNFTAEVLYNKVTGNFSTEEKYKARRTIDYKESAKIVGTANFMLPLLNDSDKRRACIIAFTKHYSKEYTPRDEFGHQLFEDWTGEMAIEWDLFYLFMVDCIRMFMVHGIDSFYHSEEEQIVEVNQNEFIGKENAKLKSRWTEITGLDHKLVQSIMEDRGYVLQEIRKRLKGETNASTLYYFEKA